MEKFKMPKVGDVMTYFIGFDEYPYEVTWVSQNLGGKWIMVKPFGASEDKEIRVKWNPEFNGYTKTGRSGWWSETGNKEKKIDWYNGWDF
jgi:hypothetical protein